MNLEDHPTVRLLSTHAVRGTNQQPAEEALDGAWLRHLALDLGADDGGLVEIARPGLDPQREEILRNYPWTKSLLSIARVPVDATILDAADEAGVFIDNTCRSGTCGSCRVKLISGTVSMAAEDALTEQDKAEGYILTCQAKIRGDVKFDA